MSTETHAVPPVIAQWHELARTRDPAGLTTLLADDCVFRSPAVHTPIEGRARTTAYLTAALVVLGPALRYVAEWYAEDSAVLEFETEIDGLSVHGVDIIRWNDEGRITSFTVMVRPYKGLEILMRAMQAELTARSR